MLLLSRDDLLAICRESSAPMSRARAWIDVCGATRGQSEGVVLAASKAPAKRFKAYEPGYVVHVDVTYLPQMANQKAGSYLFVAIDPDATPGTVPCDRGQHRAGKGHYPSQRKLLAGSGEKDAGAARPTPSSQRITGWLKKDSSGMTNYLF